MAGKMRTIWQMRASVGSYTCATLSPTTCEIRVHFLFNFDIGITHRIIRSLCSGGSGGGGGGGGGGGSGFLNFFGHLDVKRALSG